MTKYHPKITRKIFQTGKYSYIITIPKDLIRYLGWQKGDSIEMDVDKAGKKLLISKFKF
ncbi:MAG: AbrB/MazE/SpoVT family DNA-binding domain-containing protein [Patescibacteria group bacterium]|jgi:bifunctional DNA-binding transcriptional regulator/antitoxin component of YhaV-PrlF toxin-antitoxin module